MIIDLTSLITNKKTMLEINDLVEVSDELLKGSNIRKLDNVLVKGTIKKLFEEYEFSGVISGKMILPDDLTLEDVEVPIEIEFNEIFAENEVDNENNLTIIQNRLDIFPFLWQNIVLEVPLKVVSDKNRNIKLEGNGWRLITEEELELESSNSSPFSNLQELIDSRKE